MHTKGQTLAFIENVFGKATLSNGGLNASVVCPVCNETTGETEKRKLVIRTDNWLVHCWVCGYKAGSLFGLLKKYHPAYLDEYKSEYCSGYLQAKLSKEEEESEFDELKKLIQNINTNKQQNTTATNKAFELPKQFSLLAPWFEDEDSPWYIQTAKKYLVNRGLTLDDFWYYKLGVINTNEYKNKVVTVSHDAEGNLNHIIARAIDPKIKPKYYSPIEHRSDIIFNEINIDWNEELVLVEGVFDMFKAGQNATCLLGKELTEHYKLFRKIVEHKTPVLVALDSDAKKDAVRLAKLIYGYGNRVRLLEYPKNSTKDPGAMTKTEFMGLAKHATVFNEWTWLSVSIADL
jgi:hypothetical protein